MEQRVAGVAERIEAQVAQVVGLQEQVLHTLSKAHVAQQQHHQQHLQAHMQQQQEQAHAAHAHARQQASAFQQAQAQLQPQQLGELEVHSILAQLRRMEEQEKELRWVALLGLGARSQAGVLVSSLNA